VSAFVDQFQLGGKNVGLANETWDIDVQDVQLGTIDNPFKMIDPYIEFASNGKGKIVGVRLGAEQMYGKVYSTVNTLSGDMAAELMGVGKDIVTSKKNAYTNIGDLNLVDCNNCFDIAEGFVVAGLATLYGTVFGGLCAATFLGVGCLVDAVKKSYQGLARDSVKELINSNPSYYNELIAELIIEVLQGKFLWDWV
jgi:hypothetical protein